MQESNKGAGGRQSDVIMRHRRGAGQHGRQVQVSVSSIVMEGHSHDSRFTRRAVLPNCRAEYSWALSATGSKAKSMPHSVSPPPCLQLREESQRKFSHVHSLEKPMAWQPVRWDSVSQTASWTGAWRPGGKDPSGSPGLGWHDTGLLTGASIVRSHWHAIKIKIHLPSNHSRAKSL